MATLRKHACVPSRASASSCGSSGMVSCVSQVFKTWDELETAAADKRRELEARGWHSEP